MVCTVECIIETLFNFFRVVNILWEIIRPFCIYYFTYKLWETIYGIFRKIFIVKKIFILFFICFTYEVFYLNNIIEWYFVAFIQLLRFIWLPIIGFQSFFRVKGDVYTTTVNFFIAYFCWWRLRVNLNSKN